MEEKRRYVWEVEIEANYVEARRDNEYLYNRAILENIERQIEKVKKISELAKMAEEANVLHKSIIRHSYATERKGELTKIIFDKAKISFSVNVYGAKSDEKHKIIKSYEKKSTEELLNEFLEKLEVEREKQIQILNELEKYEITEYS